MFATHAGMSVKAFDAIGKDWAGNERRLGMLVLHEDEEHEYAYRPVEGLPETKVGTFTQG